MPPAATQQAPLASRWPLATSPSLHLDGSQLITCAAELSCPLRSLFRCLNSISARTTHPIYVNNGHGYKRHIYGVLRSTMSYQAHVIHGYRSVPCYVGGSVRNFGGSMRQFEGSVDIYRNLKSISIYRFIEKIRVCPMADTDINGRYDLSIVSLRCPTLVWNSFLHDVICVRLSSRLPACGMCLSCISLGPLVS